MTPYDVVKAQLDAYNAKDIDAFMACWSPDAEMFSHPNVLLAQGHSDIKARHVLRFLEPDLHAQLISRIVLGHQVVDTELVTRKFEQGICQIDVVGIYDVENGLIRRAWFLVSEPRMKS